MNDLKGETINKFFLLLKESHDLKWNCFCAELGYDCKRLLNISNGNRDDVLTHLLTEWATIITRREYDPVIHLYWALDCVQHANLQQRLLHCFDLKETPKRPTEFERTIIKRELAQVVIEPDHRKKHTDTLLLKNHHGLALDELLNICKDIWDKLSTGEIEELKVYLHTKYKSKFGKARLENVKNGVDLMRLLQERDCLDVNNTSVLNELLTFIKRVDLNRKVEDYTSRRPLLHNDAREITFFKRIGNNKDQNCAPNIEQSLSLLLTLEEQITEEEKMLSEIPRKKKLTLLKIDQQKQSMCKITAENKELSAKDDLKAKELAECVEIIKTNENKIRLLRKENEKLNESKKAIEKEIIDIHESKKANENATRACVNRLNQLTEALVKDGQREQDSKRSLERLKEEHMIKKGHLEVLRNRPCVCSNNLTIGSASKEPKADSSTNVIMQEVVEPDGPLNNDILIVAPEENKDTLKRLQTDIEEIYGDNRHIIKPILITQEITEDFLSATNKLIENAKLLFILGSKVFTERCWPDICTMKNLNSAFYDQKPLIVPVCVEKDTKFPMGMKATQHLLFYRRDSYYRETLSSFIRKHMC